MGGDWGEWGVEAGCEEGSHYRSGRPPTLDLLTLGPCDKPAPLRSTYRYPRRTCPLSLPALSLPHAHPHHVGPLIPLTLMMLPPSSPSS